MKNLQLIKETGKIRISSNSQNNNKYEIWHAKIDKLEQKQKRQKLTEHHLNHPHTTTLQLQIPQRSSNNLNSSISPQNASPFTFLPTNSSKISQQKKYCQNFQNYLAQGTHHVIPPPPPPPPPPTNSTINTWNTNPNNYYKTTHENFGTYKMRNGLQIPPESKLGNKLLTNIDNNQIPMEYRTNTGIHNQYEGNKYVSPFKMNTWRQNTQHRPNLINLPVLGETQTTNNPIPTPTNTNTNHQNIHNHKFNKNIQSMLVFGQEGLMQKERTLAGRPLSSGNHVQGSNYQGGLLEPQIAATQQVIVSEQGNMLAAHQVQEQIEQFFRFFLLFLEKQIQEYQKIHEAKKQPQNKLLTSYLEQGIEKGFLECRNYPIFQQKPKKKKTVNIMIMDNNPQKELVRRQEKEQFFGKMSRNKNYQVEDNYSGNFDAILEGNAIKKVHVGEIKNGKRIRDRKESDQGLVGKAQSINPQVSQFTLFVNLEYKLDIRWAQQPQKILTRLKKQTILISEHPTYMQIYESIMLDLKSKNLYNDEISILQMIQCSHKKDTPNIFQKLFLGKKIKWTKDYFYVGSLLKKKIVLPYGYQALPKFFSGFLVDNFTIMNKFGKIIWMGGTDLAGIKFNQEKIKICQNQVECTIPELEKLALVEFYTLPTKLKMLKGRKQIEASLKNLVSLSKNAKFIDLDHKMQSWTVQVDFAKQQFYQQDNDVSLKME